MLQPLLIAAVVLLGVDADPVSAADQSERHYSHIKSFYSELDWHDQEEESGLIVLFFPKPVVYDGKTFDRVAMFFESKPPASKGYEDPADQRIVLNRNLRDFAAVLSMLKDSGWSYVSWYADSNKKIIAHHLLAGGGGKAPREASEMPGIRTEKPRASTDSGE